MLNCINAHLQCISNLESIVFKNLDLQIMYINEIYCHLSVLKDSNTCMTYIIAITYTLLASLISFFHKKICKIHIKQI